MTEAPVIETERLILRAHRLDDFQPMAAMWSDPEVVRHIGGQPFDASSTWQRLQRHPGQWALCGFGSWAVEDRASGRYAGDAGLLEMKRDIEPDFGGAPEAGWAFLPDFHGKGYASEALAAVFAWSDANLDAPRTVCIIDAGNAASIRVAEKQGFGFAHMARFRGAEIGVYIRPRQTERISR